MEPDEDAPSLRLFFARLETICNTWAVGGSHEVLEKAGGKTNVKYADWADCCQYALSIRIRIENMLGRYTEDSLLAYVTKCEEEIRTEAIVFSRPPESRVWGQAIIRSQDKNTHIWQDNKDILVLRPGAHSMGLRALPPRGGAVGAQAPHARARSRHRARTGPCAR